MDLVAWRGGACLVATGLGPSVRDGITEPTSATDGAIRHFGGFEMDFDLTDLDVRQAGEDAPIYGCLPPPFKATRNLEIA